MSVLRSDISKYQTKRILNKYVVTVSHTLNSTRQVPLHVPVWRCCGRPRSLRCIAPRLRLLTSEPLQHSRQPPVGSSLTPWSSNLINYKETLPPATAVSVGVLRALFHHSKIPARLQCVLYPRNHPSNYHLSPFYSVGDHLDSPCPPYSVTPTRKLLSGMSPNPLTRSSP
jgi:hypothetical protein